MPNRISTKWIDDGYYHTETRDIKRIGRVLIITMLLNFAATVVKLAAGISIGALSVVADGLDSLFDGLSNIVGLAGLSAAARPPDTEHPYGHRKFETVAALIIAFLLFMTCWQILQSAWERFRESNAPEVNIWTVGAMILSMIIQVGTSFYELNQGRKLNSEVLIADALHTRASSLISLSVLVGLVLVRIGYPRADPLLAVFVAVMIAKIGIDILRETLPVLVDRAAIDPQRIARIVEGVDGVESFHRVRSRGAKGSASVDFHLRVSPDKTIQEGDAIATEVRRRLLLLNGISDVTVHLEAQRDLQANADDIFAMLRHIANGLCLTVHESWVQRVDELLVVEVHLGVDPQLTLGEAHTLVDRFEKEVRQRFPEVDAVHTHIEMASKQIIQGSRASPEMEAIVRREVKQVVDSIAEIYNPHNLQVRLTDGDKSAYYVSVECVIAPETPVADAHYLSDRIEHELSLRLDGVVEVSVHLEPVDADDPTE